MYVRSLVPHFLLFLNPADLFGFGPARVGMIRWAGITGETQWHALGEKNCTGFSSP